MRILLIGAGPTGLGLASRLEELNFDSQDNSLRLIERSNSAGGLSSTIRDNKGYYWDLGGHVVFSHYDYFTNLLDNLPLTWNHQQRNATIVFRTEEELRFVPYPLQRNIDLLPRINRQDCLLGLQNRSIGQETEGKDIENFEEWTLRIMGQGIYDLFMRPYNRKVWTVEPSTMSSIWIKQRVATPNYEEIRKRCDLLTTQENKTEKEPTPFQKLKDEATSATCSKLKDEATSATCSKLKDESKDATCSKLTDESKDATCSKLIDEAMSFREVKDESKDVSLQCHDFTDCAAPIFNCCSMNITGELPKLLDCSARDNWGPNSEFRFPQEGGTGRIWTQVAEKLSSGSLHYNTEVIAISVADKRLTLRNTITRETTQTQYDVLVSTMPLNKLLDSIVDSDPVALQVKKVASRLEYNSVHVIGVGIRGSLPKYLTNKTWIYFPQDDIPFYRVTVFSNYSTNNSPVGCWSLLCETSSRPLSKKRKSEKSEFRDLLIKDAMASLVRYGFIKDLSNIDNIFYSCLEQGYPIPYLNRDRDLATVQSWLESNDIYSRGRFGGWKYEVSNLDHCFMQGVELADRLYNGIPEITYFDPDYVNSGRRIGRYSPLPSIRPKRLCTYVISQYRENLKWLKDTGIAPYCHVYHKGGDQLPNFDVWRWETLPNVGREAHTILHYIITHYDNLPDVVVFLQGRIDDHFKVHQDPRQYYYWSDKDGRCFPCVETYNNWGRIVHIEPWLSQLKNGNMKASPYTFADFWKLLFESSKHPNAIVFNYHACFGVRREKIRARPLRFYQRAMKFVDNHVNPENGHYFERCWFSIFQ